MTPNTPDFKWENMLAGIQAQVPFLNEAPKIIYEQIKEKIQFDRIPERIYLTGCGDSWYCGMATAYAFNRWTGIPTEALQALDFSRYKVEYAPQNSLVVAVSNSGRVSRTIEAILQANNAGLYTLACTSNLTEGIGRHADGVIDLAYAERRFAPGTSSYLASLVVEYCLALYLAECNQRMTGVEVREKLEELASLAAGMERTLNENWDTLEGLRRRARLEDRFVFIGGGPNLGTAHFSAAKTIEAARANAVGQELEEWAHIQYFYTDKNTLTFLLAPPGASLDRSREILDAIKQTGSTSVIVCDANDRETLASADIAIPVYSGEDETLTPLVYCLPGELFVYFMGVSKGLNIFGFDNQHTKQVNFKTIYKSKIRS